MPWSFGKRLSVPFCQIQSYNLPISVFTTLSQLKIGQEHFLNEKWENAAHKCSWICCPKSQVAKITIHKGTNCGMDLVVVNDMWGQISSRRRQLSTKQWSGNKCSNVLTKIQTSNYGMDHWDWPGKQWWAELHSALP